MRKGLRHLTLGRETLLWLDRPQLMSVAGATGASCPSDCPTNAHNCPTTFYISCPSLDGPCQSVAC